MCPAQMGFNLIIPMSGHRLSHGIGDHRMVGIGWRRMIDPLRIIVPDKDGINTAEDIDLVIGGLNPGGQSNSDGNGVNTGLGRSNGSNRCAVEGLRTSLQGRAQPKCQLQGC